MRGLTEEFLRDLFDGTSHHPDHIIHPGFVQNRAQGSSHAKGRDKGTSLAQFHVDASADGVDGKFEEVWTLV